MGHSRTSFCFDNVPLNNGNLSIEKWEELRQNYTVRVGMTISRLVNGIGILHQYYTSIATLEANKKEDIGLCKFLQRIEAVHITYVLYDGIKPIPFNDIFLIKYKGKWNAVFTVTGKNAKNELVSIYAFNKAESYLSTGFKALKDDCIARNEKFSF